MTIDVNAIVRYTTGGSTYKAKVAQVKNGHNDMVDLKVYGLDGTNYVQDVSRSADGVVATTGTWHIGLGVY